LPWYVASAGADATSTPDAAALAERYGNGPTPPVVIAESGRRVAVAEQLGPTYEPTTYRLGLWNREVVVFVDREGTGGEGA
jgi:predicted membrane-bound mannosyltransferase